MSTHPYAGKGPARAGAGPSAITGQDAQTGRRRDAPRTGSSAVFVGTRAVTMSYSTDDQRILDAIERRLTHDDPALATRIDALNKQFPHIPRTPEATEAPEGGRTRRRSPRVVVAAVLAVIALLALILTIMLGSRSTPPAGVDGGPAALSSLSAYDGRALQ
ncbi:DUF3040 domain-containing protein [Streptomyces sp. NPDC018338]|uniref:DUF3040 domain-containing protein n=1 Tax=Streptomyces sp. NPDC018338 TaxID=3157192 RepID=UPI0033D2DA38